MDFDLSVVADETKLAEFVHEKADPRSSRPDHFSQGFLTNIRTDQRRIAFLAEVGQQKKQPGKTLFARIEQLVDQISFNPTVPGQQVSQKQFRKPRFVVQYGYHCGFRYRSNQTFFHRSRRRDAQFMSIETPLAKELARLQNPNDRFLAMVRQNDDLRPALLNVEYRIRSFSLREDDLILLIRRYRFPYPDFGEKPLRVERIVGWLARHRRRPAGELVAHYTPRLAPITPRSGEPCKKREFRSGDSETPSTSNARLAAIGSVWRVRDELI